MSTSTPSADTELSQRRDLVREARTAGAPDPLLEARLVVPRRHVGTLRRTRLLRQLRSARDRPVISIVAPPGYGKSSLLVQWATEDSGPVAWLTADDSDSDPVVFLTDLAAAIDRHVPLGSELFSAIASGTVSHRTVVGRLLAAMSRPPEPVRIAIDDVHRITSRACLDILAELVEHLPEGRRWRSPDASRTRLPFARWRAEGSLLEIGPAELAMDEREAVGLGRELGLRLPAETATRLTRETEGWPALLALAMLGARTSPEGSDRIDAGTDHLIDDYLRSEVLERRSTAEITFLTRTSILDHLPAPLCDVVADRHGSTDVLRQLARSTLLMDDYGGSYRYHTLLRDFLQRELAVREPDRVTDPPPASRCVVPGEPRHRARRRSRLRGRRPRPRRHAGRQRLRPDITGPAIARRSEPGPGVWASDALEARPWLAVLAAWEEIAAGDVAATIRFADVAERGTFEGRPPDGTASFEAGRAMLRAGMVRQGADDALANATRAVELEGDHGSWRDFALWQLAFARLTIGDVAGADAALADAVVAARSSGDVAVWYCVLGHRALVAAEQGAWDAAAALIAESDAIDPAPQIDGYLSSVPSRAVRIRLMIHRGDIAGARRELARATGLRPLLTAAAPGRSRPAPSRVRARPCRDRRPGRRARPDRPGERRDPRSPRPRRPACRGGRAPGDPGRTGARARRGRHEPHGRRASRPVVPALLPLIQGDRAAPRRQGDDDQVASARDLPEAGRGDPQRRRRPGRRGRTPRALPADRRRPCRRVEAAVRRGS